MPPAAFLFAKNARGVSALPIHTRLLLREYRHKHLIFPIRERLMVHDLQHMKNHASRPDAARAARNPSRFTLKHRVQQRVREFRRRDWTYPCGALTNGCFITPHPVRPTATPEWRGGSRRGGPRSGRGSSITTNAAQSSWAVRVRETAVTLAKPLTSPPKNSGGRL